MSNLFQAPVLIVSIADRMHNALAGSGGNGGEIVVVVI